MAEYGRARWRAPLRERKRAGSSPWRSTTLALRQLDPGSVASGQNARRGSIMGEREAMGCVRYRLEGDRGAWVAWIPGDQSTCARNTLAPAGLGASSAPEVARDDWPLLGLAAQHRLALVPGAASSRLARPSSAASVTSRTSSTATSARSRPPSSKRKGGSRSARPAPPTASSRTCSRSTPSSRAWSRSATRAGTSRPWATSWFTGTARRRSSTGAAPF